MSDSANTAPYGRGVCPVCGDEFNKRKDGRARAHASRTRWRMNCEGGGEKPREVSDVE